DPGEATLAARLKECMIAGQTGIPRDELLDYLGRTADALDTLYEQHRLQHLSLTPRQLVLQDGELYIMDHRLVELFLLPGGGHAATPSRVGAPTVPERSPAVVPIPANQGQAALEETINGLVAAPTRDRELREHGQILYRMRPGPSIEHLCFARLILGTAKLK